MMHLSHSQLGLRLANGEQTCKYFLFQSFGVSVCKVLTFILTRLLAVESILLCYAFAPRVRLGQLMVDALVQLQTFSADEEVHIDTKALLLLL